MAAKTSDLKASSSDEMLRSIVDAGVARNKMNRKLGDVVDGRYLQSRAAIEVTSPGMKDVLFLTGRKVGEYGASLLFKERVSLEKVLDVLANYWSSGHYATVTRRNASGKTFVRVDECAMAFGLPNIGQPICYYDAGVISGLLSYGTGKRVIARETKCYALGDSCCEYELQENKQ
ncbi:MAG TPA: V4R domain-containing protein [Candidatus Norongarragalinales archaeon]|jgi:predicted hydrocarbon binding protein|nr:V4R domain-containing protein [Candidatus Norongarragalinales archaeon]